MGIWGDITARMGIGRENPAVTEARDSAYAKLESSLNKDVPSWFAIRAGTDLAEMPDRELATKFPGVRETSMGRIPNLGNDRQSNSNRKKHIALAAYEMANQFMEHGDNRGLGADLGRAARSETLSTLARHGVNEFSPDSLGKQLDVRHETLAVNTDKYLEISSVAERAAGNVASRSWREEDKKDMEAVLERYDGSKIKDKFFDEQADMKHAVSVEIAMARAGVISPQRIVRRANEWSVVDARKDAEEAMAGDPSAQRIARVRPDFEAGRKLEPRTAEYMAAVHRQYSTKEQPIPDAMAHLRPTAPQKAPAEKQHRKPVEIAAGRNAAITQARGVGMAG